LKIVKEEKPGVNRRRTKLY